MVMTLAPGALESEPGDEEAFLIDSEKEIVLKPRDEPWRVILGFILTASLALIAGVLLEHYLFSNKDWTCTSHVSQNTPLLNQQIDLSYHTIRYDGTFMKENIYRQVGRPEVDEAWEALGVNYRSVVIPEAQAEQAGFRHDQVKINPKHGGGFPANVEGLHHLHCLNLLRQGLWFNFDYYHQLGKGAFKNDDGIAGTAHCLDILRQQLMCKPDLGFLGQIWHNQSFPSAFVDFNTQHKCRNYEALRQWAEVRQLPEHVPPDFLQPPEKGDKIYAEIP